MRRAIPLLLVVGFAACGDGTANTSPSTTTSQATVTSSTTTAPTTDPLIVVAIGDSTPNGFGVGSLGAYPVLYGDLLTSDLGREVTVRNHATGQDRTVADWSDVVRSDQDVAADLADADVVMVWMGWHDVLPIVFYQSPDGWPDPLQGDLTEKSTEMTSTWPALLDVLRETSPEAVILVADTGIPTPVIDTYGAEAFWPDMKRLVYLDWRDALIGAAASSGAIVVPTAEAMGGPDYEAVLHPEFGSEDGLHLNEAGQMFLAELHRQHDGLGGG